MLSGKNKFVISRLVNSDFVSLGFAVFILFSIIRYIGFFQTPIYPTISRETVVTTFQHPITPTLLVDHIIIIFLGMTVLYCIINNAKVQPIFGAFATLAVFLATTSEVSLDVFALLMLPATVLILLTSHFTKRKLISKCPSWKNLLFNTILVACIFEILVLIFWITFPFAPQAVEESPLWYAISLEFELFYAMALLSPALVILATWWFATRPSFPIIAEFLKISHKIKPYTFAQNVLFNPKIVFAIAIAISLVFVFYPYFPTINPTYHWVSVDDFAYQGFLEDLNSQDNPSDVINKAFTLSSGDRPLTLLIMHSFYAVSGLEILSAVRFFPVFLGPGLVTAVYLFVRTGTKNRHYAAYAALLTAFSHQVIVGIYAGFFSNWLGLIALYLAFLMIIRFWENPSVKNYLLVVGHSVLSFLMYIYVDVYFLLTLLAFLIITAIKYWNSSFERKKVLILSTIFGIYGAVFLFRITFGSSDLFDTVFAREDIAFSITEFRNRWLNFPSFMHYYVGGFFANAALLAFTVLWSLQARFEHTFDRILLAALVVGAIPLIFGDVVLQSRIYYDIPVQIMAAIAILRLVNSTNFNSRNAKIAFLLLSIHFVVYAIRSLSNFVLEGA